MSAAAHYEGAKPSPVTAPHPPGPATCTVLVPEREAAFLDLVFPSSDRPGLVTDLLAIAATSSSSSECHPRRMDEASRLWRLSLAQRLKLLLHIVRDTEGLPALPVRLCCPHADCRQFLEIELPFAGLDALHEEADDHKVLEFPGAGTNSLTFRRPTGDDLRRWRAAAETGPVTPQSLFRDLVVPAPETPEAPVLPGQALADAFAEFDSLVAFRLTTFCPHCGRESSCPVDLETLALTRLEALQQRLFQENHRLARAYGWSEADILQVPHPRRVRYRAPLEATN
jgi:hypothetical protein